MILLIERFGIMAGRPTWTNITSTPGVSVRLGIVEEAIGRMDDTRLVSVGTERLLCGIHDVVGDASIATYLFAGSDISSFTLAFNPTVGIFPDLLPFFNPSIEQEERDSLVNTLVDLRKEKAEGGFVDTMTLTTLGELGLAALLEYRLMGATDLEVWHIKNTPVFLLAYNYAYPGRESRRREVLFIQKRSAENYDLEKRFIPQSQALLSKGSFPLDAEQALAQKGLLRQFGLMLPSRAHFVADIALADVLAPEFKVKTHAVRASREAPFGYAHGTDSNLEVFIAQKMRG